MDEKLQNQVFNYIKDAAEKIGDFARTEIPPFINEFLRWKFWEAGFYVSCWVLALLCWATAVIFYYLKRKVNIKKDFENEGFVFISVSSMTLLCVMVPFFCGLAKHILTMIQIYVAPKVFLLEQAKEFI